MTRPLFILTSLFLFVSCRQVNQSSDGIKLSDKGDTLEIIKKYPSSKIKTIIYYNDNIPFKNIGFYENGDTIKSPRVVFVPADSSLFAFIPIKKGFTYDILLGLDSIKYTDTYYQNILKEVCSKLEHLKTSTSFRLRYELVSDSMLKGVFKYIDSTDINAPFKYYPFETKINYR
jgi:hypothetical protein